MEAQRICFAGELHQRLAFSLVAEMREMYAEVHRSLLSGRASYREVRHPIDSIGEHEVVMVSVTGLGEAPHSVTSFRGYGPAQALLSAHWTPPSLRLYGA